MGADTMDRPWPFPIGRITQLTSGPVLEAVPISGASLEAEKTDTRPRVLLLDPEPLTTALHWLDASTGKPYADERVLLWIADPDGSCDWWEGWWDGEDWRLCESVGIVDGKVLFFAQPMGPGSP